MKTKILLLLSPILRRILPEKYLKYEKTIIFLIGMVLTSTGVIATPYVVTEPYITAVSVSPQGDTTYVMSQGDTIRFDRGYDERMNEVIDMLIDIIGAE